MSNEESNKVAIEIERERRGEQDDDDIVTLSTGVRVRLKPIPPGLPADVRARIKVPPPPKFFNETKGRWEENPGDPTYAAVVANLEEQRNAAAIRAMVMSGFELVDGLPDDDKWLRKLQISNPELDVDPDDDVATEFYYLLYHAVGAEDYSLLQQLVVTAEGVASAEAGFRRNATRRSNR